MSESVTDWDFRVDTVRFTNAARQMRDTVERMRDHFEERPVTGLSGRTITLHMASQAISADTLRLLNGQPALRCGVCWPNGNEVCSCNEVDQGGQVE